MLYTPGFLDFLQALNREGARRLLIGGYAVAFCGYPRATKDLDPWIEASPENAARVLAVIRVFFGETPGPGGGRLPFPGVIQLGYAPNRIDLVILPEDPLSFEEAYARAEEALVEGIPVPVVGREDLLVLKRASPWEASGGPKNPGRKTTGILAGSPSRTSARRRTPPLSKTRSSMP